MNEAIHKKQFSLSIIGLLLIMLVSVSGTTHLMAQPSQPAKSSHMSRSRLSPHETISQTFDGKRDNRVTIVYGRPNIKDPKSGEIRKVWGRLVPFGKVWRLGADEATLLVTQQPLVIGETTIPAGAYTLFMLPEETGSSKLIVNKQIGQWGVSYDEKQDLARIDLKKDAAEKPTPQFTIALEKNPTGGGVLKLTWEDTQFSLPLTIKQ